MTKGPQHQPHIQINASTTTDRNTAIAQLQDALSEHRGWIIDHHAFSNISMNLQIELRVETMPALAEALENIGILLTRRSTKALCTFAEEHPHMAPSDTCPGTFQITFIHNEPDLKQVIPHIPG